MNHPILLPLHSSRVTTDTLLSEDSGKGLTLYSSWRSSQATLSSSTENPLSAVRPIGKKSQFSHQSEQGVSVNTERAKAKQEGISKALITRTYIVIRVLLLTNTASGISHLSIPADPQVLSVPVMQMHAAPSLVSD